MSLIQTNMRASLRDEEVQQKSHGVKALTWLGITPHIEWSDPREDYIPDHLGSRLPICTHEGSSTKAESNLDLPFWAWIITPWSSGSKLLCLELVPRALVGPWVSAIFHSEVNELAKLEDSPITKDWRNINKNQEKMTQKLMTRQAL